MKVDKISLFLEIEGKPHVALLEDENKELIIDVLSSVCKHGVLRVTKLPDDFRFEPLSKHIPASS